MRVPGTWNTKVAEDFKLCETLADLPQVYTCEELDRLLPRITPEDEAYCQDHYDRTYDLKPETKVDERLPPKFAKLIAENPEVRAIWLGETDDRSVADYRLGHLMFASRFTRGRSRQRPGELPEGVRSRS